MPKAVFSIEPKEIAKWCIHYFEEEEFFKKNKYNVKLPKISEESKQAIKKSRTGPAWDKYFEEFMKEYDKQKHEDCVKTLEPKWRKIEGQFFSLAEGIVGKKWPHETYNCVCSFYGPGGSYWDDTVFLIASKKDAYETIAHELIHTLIDEEIEKNKIEHWTKERIVDSYLARTKLRELFEPAPRIQHVDMLSPVDGLFKEENVKISTIIEKLKKK